MKKTMNMMLAMMAGAMAFTACSSDDILENIENNEVTEVPSLLKPMTFTAVQEGDGGTRAAIATDTDGKANGINWTAGDKISIFDGAIENGGVQMFTIENGAGTSSATFNGSAVEAATYYALYPYAVGETLISVTKDDAVAAFGGDEYGFKMEIEDDWNRNYYMDPEIAEELVKDAFIRNGVSEENQAIILAYLKNQPIGTPGVTLDGSSIKNVVIPAEQTVATGQTADPQAMIMVARGDDKDALQFKNVCAYVKVTPQFDCYAICLTSKGTENIAGKVTVNYNEGEPTTTVTADGTNSVSLVGSISAGNVYYIAVLPGSLASGFTIEFLTDGDKKYYARSTNNALALARSNVKNLGEFATTGTWDYANLATSGNDGAGHDWALFTPTLKLYSSNTVNKARFNDITPWDGWALPTAEDLEGANIYIEQTNTIIQGLGILKYTSRYAPGEALSFWTSTPGYSTDYESCWNYFSEGISDNALKTTPMAYIFKYNN